MVVVVVAKKEKQNKFRELDVFKDVFGVMFLDRESRVLHTC